VCMAVVSEGLLALSIVLMAVGVFLIIAPFVPYPLQYLGWVLFVAGIICIAYWIYKQAKAS
jgi:hypothetical protein